jgi:hypothetical protein
VRPLAAKTVAVALILLAIATGPSADAHGGSAVFKVIEASSRDGRVVEIDVAVTYSADRERAEAAILEAVGHGPPGHTTAPIELTRLSGGIYRLRTTVDTSGVWRFDIDSRFPPGSTVITVKVTDNSSSSRGAWWLLGAAIVAAGVIIGLVLRRRSRHR